MNTFNSILVDVDASAMAQPALGWAAALARRTGARLRIVHVMPPSAQSSGIRPEQLDDLLRVRRQQLARLATTVADTVSGVDVLTGPVVPALLHAVEQGGHDLVVRNHHRDTAARFVGDSAIETELFRRCPCAVLAVRHRARPPQLRVAVAVDVPSADPVKRLIADRLVDVGLSFARSLNGSLSLINAWQPDVVASSRTDAVRSLATLADACDAGPVARRITIRHGSAEDVLPEFVVAEGVDLLVVGTSGRTGMATMPQSNTAEHLLARVPCSVIAVRSPALAA